MSHNHAGRELCQMNFEGPQFPPHPVHTKLGVGAVLTEEPGHETVT